MTCALSYQHLLSQSRILAALIAALALVTAASAQSSVPSFGPPVVEGSGTDGTVLAMARSGETLYIGGSFSYVGPDTGGSCVIDATTGPRPGPLAAVRGTVQAVASDGASGWLVGGQLER